MANVNIYVAGVVANRRRAPNLLRVACVNEEGEHISTRLTARQSHELALQYKQRIVSSAICYHVNKIMSCKEVSLKLLLRPN